MTTNDLLERVAGRATRDKLYHLEKLGFLRPDKLTRGGNKMQGRSYPPEEVRKLEIILSKQEEGYTLKAAFDLACRQLTSEGATPRFRLLVIESDSVTQRLLQFKFGDVYRLEFASDSRRAHAIISSHRIWDFDIVIVDLMLEKDLSLGRNQLLNAADGELCVQALQRRIDAGAPPDCRAPRGIFVLSTLVVSSLSVRLNSLGIRPEHIFAKPFSLDVLGAFVGRLCASEPQEV
jgi:CheY-like chemotaxis protein